MPKAKASPWNRKETQPDGDASSYAVNTRLLHRCVADTVVEVRGDFSKYRVGDVLQSIRGAKFHI